MFYFHYENLISKPDTIVRQLLEWLPSLQSLEIDRSIHSSTNVRGTERSIHGTWTWTTLCTPLGTLSKCPRKLTELALEGRESSILEYASSAHCKLEIVNLTTNAKWLERMKYSLAAEA